MASPRSMSLRLFQTALFVAPLTFAQSWVTVASAAGVVRVAIATIPWVDDHGNPAPREPDQRILELLDRESFALLPEHLVAVRAEGEEHPAETRSSWDN